MISSEVVMPDSMSACSSVSVLPVTSYGELVVGAFGAPPPVGTCE